MHCVANRPAVLVGHLLDLALTQRHEVSVLRGEVLQIRELASELAAVLRAPVPHDEVVVGGILEAGYWSARDVLQDGFHAVAPRLVQDEDWLLTR